MMPTEVRCCTRCRGPNESAHEVPERSGQLEKGENSLGERKNKKQEEHQAENHRVFEVHRSSLPSGNQPLQRQGSEDECHIQAHLRAIDALLPRPNLQMGERP